MADFDNTNRGVLFPNDKGDNDKRPDEKGKLNVEGVEYEVAVWKKTDRNGKPFKSMSVKRKEVDDVAF